MKTPVALVALTLALALTSGCSAERGTTTSGPMQPASGGSAVEPSLDGASLPPWAAPTDVPARAASAGLNLGPMGTAEHYHPHLRIIIDGTDVPVARNIGVDPATGAMSALHTHEGDGTIHIESDTEGAVFTLGQLFVQWGVKLTSRQIGGVRAESGSEVEVTSNGDAVVGDPMDLTLAPEQEIVLTVG
ncbi:hypothetical protein CXG46_21005 [Nocardioides alpinus]|uniref:Uncharacterized protein n=2 Tax=Nocardioides alpinus TaxID=748909 RepID=A0ABX4QTK0_9ACTN|nr:hypothetical protein CXG46_21005 [Nocardioides alpinus]